MCNFWWLHIVLSTQVYRCIIRWGKEIPIYFEVLGSDSLATADKFICDTQGVLTKSWKIKRLNDKQTWWLISIYVSPKLKLKNDRIKITLATLINSYVWTFLFLFFFFSSIWMEALSLETKILANQVLNFLIGWYITSKRSKTWTSTPMVPSHQIIKLLIWSITKIQEHMMQPCSIYC